MKSKKFVLAALALLAITGLLALSGCKNDSVSDEMEIPAGFVYIPAGTFQMGSTARFDNEKPVHGVTISKGYFMGKCEVTQEEYEKYCSYTGGEDKKPTEEYGVGDEYPAYYVSWYDAVVFCNELTKKVLDPGACVYYSDADFTKVYTTSDGVNKGTPYMNISKSGYRLPTEAEWELAARGGNKDADPWKYTYAGTNEEDTLKNYAWYSYEGSDSKTHEVGTKAANSLELYDMSGNVWEWCWDWWASSIEAGTPSGGAASGSGRVIRGGGWFQVDSNSMVSQRFFSEPHYRHYNLGFRLVRSAN